MFSSFRRGLKSIDFYQAVPSQYSEGTISGACISIAAISILVFLVTSSIFKFIRPTIDSDLIIDQKHLDQKLRVYIDIQFKKYPCSFLSLDIQNVLKVHHVNVFNQNLIKISLPEYQAYNEANKSDQELFDIITNDIAAAKGCRMKGFFEIDRVPGNFHFSSHAYGRVIHRLFNVGYNKFDMSHHIYELRFGNKQTQMQGQNSLKDFNSQKLIKQQYLGISYTYFLDIIQQNIVNEQGYQSYIYTARLNQVLLPQLPMVYFRYETNPMTVLHIFSRSQWHTLFIEIVGIIGEFLQQQQLLIIQFILLFISWSKNTCSTNSNDLEFLIAIALFFCLFLLLFYYSYAYLLLLHYFYFYFYCYYYCYCYFSYQLCIITIVLYYKIIQHLIIQTYWQMQLLSDPTISKKNNAKNSPHKNINSLNPLNQEWKSEEDYKRDIIALQIQNEKYRNQLYELGQTVNKILDKVKVPSKQGGHTPNLQQQLQLVKKELHNVNQFIEIYQKQLSVLNNKKKKDQIQNLASTEEILKTKTQQLASLKKQVKELAHRNKGLQYKLLQFSKKGKIKSVDQQALQLKELINQNKNLKSKLQELETLHDKKQKWLENNIESAKQLEKKVQDQQLKLPKIQSSRSIDKQRTFTSLPKLQSQKKIYTKWLQSASNTKKNNTIQKQLIQLQKINQVVQQKISSTSLQIKQIQLHIQKLKQKIQQQSEKLLQQNKNISKEKSNNNNNDDNKQKKKHVGTMVSKKIRKIRKDWVGKFDGIRFSDNRHITEQCRLYKVLFNTNGYCQFFYYSWKDNKRRFNSKLPFQTSSLLNQGKQSTFTVEYPDFIKNIRLKINLKTHRVTQMSLVSNLGIEAEFLVDTNLHNLIPGSKNTQKVSTNTKEEQPQVNYQMDIKSNEAITCIFGSYGTKLDEKKQITHVWLEGFGAQIIEDFVEELI